MNGFRALFGIFILIGSAQTQDAKPCHISVPLGVTYQRSFQPVVGLTRDSFEVKSGKEWIHPNRADSVLSDRIFLFVDASGSMTSKNNGNWPLLEGAIQELLSKLPSYMPVATDIFALNYKHFNHRDEVLHYLETYPGELGAKSPLGGRTRLYDTLLAAAQTEQMHLGDLVLLITDGGDNKSKAQIEDIIREFNSRGTRIATLFISEVGPAPRTVEEQMGIDNVTRISTGTGGFVYWVRKYQKDQKSLVPQRFYSDALSYYRLELDSAQLEGKRLDAKILGADNKKMKNIVVHKPERAPACSD